MRLITTPCLQVKAVKWSMKNRGRVLTRNLAREYPEAQELEGSEMDRLLKKCPR